MSSLEGKAAPLFALKGSDGREHRLDDYREKTVILYFYPRDNTPGCTKEACGFRDLKPHLDTLDVTLFGISKDSLDSHDKFIRQFGLPFILLSDPEAEIMRAYGAYGVKTQYGKTTVGTIRSTVVIGPDGKVAQHWVKVTKAEAHPRQVLDFLQKKQVGGTRI